MKNREKNEGHLTLVGFETLNGGCHGEHVTPRPKFINTFFLLPFSGNNNNNNNNNN